MQQPDSVPPQCLLISFPRSGLNWLRYCIESVSGRPTPGECLLYSKGEPLVARTHRAGIKGRQSSCWQSLYDEMGTARFSKILLLLRNHKESLVRAAQGQLEKMDDYFENLRLFAEFQGEKHCTYYEDLILNPHALARALRFLGLPEQLEGSLDWHRRRSLLIYHYRWGIHRAGTVDDLGYHSRSLTPEQRNEADRHAKARLGEALYQLYLGRYDESQMPPESTQEVLH